MSTTTENDPFGGRLKWVVFVVVDREFIENFGVEIRLLATRVLNRKTETTLDYRKLRESKYVNELIRLWKKSGMKQKQIDATMAFLMKNADNRGF